MLKFIPMALRTWLLPALALISILGACATDGGAIVTHTDFGQSMHDIRIQGGQSLPPERVRELFDQTAKQVCSTIDAKNGYKVLILLEEPKVIEPLWDQPESFEQSRLARRHYDVYQSNMEGKIACE